MKINYKTRRVVSLLILLVGLPLYVVLVVSGMTLLVNLPKFIELIIYLFFGVVWVFPLKFIFRGVGQSDPSNQSEP